MVESAQTTEMPEDRPAWRRLTWLERSVTALTLLVVLCFSLPQLPPGVCYGDAGDLQVASATLGIAHPPGYMGYAGAGWLLCQTLFFVEPAYVVSLACLCCMIGSLALMMLLLVRLGLHVLIAGAFAVAFAAHGSVWPHLIAPEVYAPSLLCLVGMAYLLIKYGRLRHRRDLYLAAALFGFLVINRPPALLIAPWLLAALYVIERRGGFGFGNWLRTAGRTAVCAALPIVAVLALLWVRDAPKTPYNYITQYAEVNGGIPAATQDSSSRLQRLSWLVTARQYHSHVTNDPARIGAKFGWMRQQLSVSRPDLFVLGCVFLVLGSYAMLRRGGEWVLIVWGILTGGTAFLLYYRLRDDSADLLGILFACCLVFGGALSAIFPTGSSRVRATLALLIYLGMGAAMWHRMDWLLRGGDFRDATRLLAELDFDSLPPDAVVCAGWDASRALWYKQCVDSDRQDVRIVTAHGGIPAPLAARFADRQILYAKRGPTPPGWRLTPYRNVYRMERKVPTAGMDGVTLRTEK